MKANRVSVISFGNRWLVKFHRDDQPSRPRSPSPASRQRIMDLFPAGQRDVSAAAQLSAAQRVAESLNLRGNALAGMENLSAEEVANRLRRALDALEA